MEPITHLDENASRRDILRAVLAIALPSFLNMMLNSAFTIIDSIMVGQLGAFAIAAVGLVKQPTLLLLLGVEGFTVAITRMIAREKGRNDQAAANDVLRQSILITLLYATVMAAVGCLFAPGIVSFMGANADTQGPATVYFQTILGGFLFHALGNNIGGAFTGAGDTKTILYANIASNFVNIGCNWLLIYGNLGFPALGVTGAGIATALSKVAFFGILAVLLFRKKRYIFLTLRDRYSLSRETVREYFSLGMPVVGHRAATRFGMLLMVRLVAPLGTAAMASYQMCFNIHNMGFWSADAIGKATISLTGQSVGAGKPKLALRYIRCAIALGVGFTLLTGAVILLFPAPLLRMFTPDETAIAAGLAPLVVIALFQPFQAAGNVTTGGLTGFGDTKTSAKAIAFGIAVLRPIAAYVLTGVFDLGIVGIWIAIAADEVFRFVCVTTARRKLEQAQSTPIKASPRGEAVEGRSTETDEV